jgi:diacylglycerol diphosphate phosphatase/phosphatidate phosphatase
MGLFTRRARPVDTNTATATGTTPASNTREKRPHAGGGFMGMLRGRHNGMYPETRNSRPTFGQWLKQTWIDIITMIILGAIGLGVR